MALAIRIASSQLRLLGSSTGRLVLRNGGRTSSSSTQAIREQAHKEMISFWNRNQSLKRPLSPHLSIYKPEVTSMFSLLHRATGIAMTIVWTGIGCSAWMFAGNFDSIINYAKDFHLGGAMLYAGKFVLCYPLIYHLVNGTRHLAWDRAIGFSLPTIYKTGWSVFAFAFIAAGLVASIQL